jgi:hypothetical protein
MTAEEERWARGVAGEWGYGPEYLAPLEITMARHLRLALEEIDRLRAAVAEEREACATRVEAAALRWPDEPRIAAVLRREADAICARGKGTR